MDPLDRPGLAVAGAGEALRWAVDELAPGATRSLRWAAGDEGLLQILAGSVAAAAPPALDPVDLDPATALWLRGEWELELAAPAGARVLSVRVRGAEPGPLATPVLWERVPRQQILEQMTGRSVAGGGISAWLFEIEAGYRVDDLRHAEEQISVPIDAAFEMLRDGEGSPLAPGEVAYVPPWLRHGGDFKATAVTLLEVFSPPRRGETTLAMNREGP
jgi:quercetin dioxygenase-like cupin family protein